MLKMTCDYLSKLTSKIKKYVMVNKHTHPLNKIMEEEADNDNPPPFPIPVYSIFPSRTSI